MQSKMNIKAKKKKKPSWNTTFAFWDDKTTVATGWSLLCKWGLKSLKTYKCILIDVHLWNGNQQKFIQTTSSLSNYEYLTIMNVMNYSFILSWIILLKLWTR